VVVVVLLVVVEGRWCISVGSSFAVERWVER
jgi:hypothetical protein